MTNERITVYPAREMVEQSIGGGTLAEVLDATAKHLAGMHEPDILDVVIERCGNTAWAATIYFEKRAEVADKVPSTSYGKWAEIGFECMCGYALTMGDVVADTDLAVCPECGTEHDLTDDE